MTQCLLLSFKMQSESKAANLVRASTHSCPLAFGNICGQASLIFYGRFVKTSPGGKTPPGERMNYLNLIFICEQQRTKQL